MKHQQGIALIAAIFLVVVIGVALVVLATLSSRSSQQTTQNLLQTRAQAAASAAVEYGVQFIVINDTCAPDGAVTVSAYSDFTTNISCTSDAFNSPSQQITLYEITTTAEFGQPDSPDYVWTELSATVEM